MDSDLELVEESPKAIDKEFLQKLESIPKPQSILTSDERVDLKSLFSNSTFEEAQLQYPEVAELLSKYDIALKRAEEIIALFTSEFIDKEEITLNKRKTVERNNILLVL